MDGNSDINISLQGHRLERVNTFKYLGATLADLDDRIESGWKNWKRDVNMDEWIHQAGQNSE